MSLKAVARGPTLIGTSLGNSLAALDGTFFEAIIQTLGAKKFAEPLKKSVSSEGQIGEMNDFEKAMYTIFVSHEKNGNERSLRWSEIAYALLEENIRNRYGQLLQDQGRIIELNYHRGFKISAIRETEAESLAQ